MAPQAASTLHGMRADDGLAAISGTGLRVQAVPLPHFRLVIRHHLPYKNRLLLFAIKMAFLPFLAGAAPARFIDGHSLAWFQGSR